MQKICLFVLGCLILTGCTKEVQLDIAQDERKLFVRANFNNFDDNQIFQLDITNRIYLDTMDFSIYRHPTIEMILFKNDVPIDTPKYDNLGLQGYEFNKKTELTPGDTYRIEARRTGFPLLTSTCTMPQTVVPSAATFIPNAGVYRDESNPGSQAVMKDGVDVGFVDPAGVENYYEISLLEPASWGQVYNLNLFAYLPGAFSYYGFAFISDKEFDGLPTSVRCLIMYPSQNDVRNLKLRFASISKEKYEYFKSLTLQNTDNPFAEPSNIISNIQNGYGCFSIDNVIEVGIQ